MNFRKAHCIGRRAWSSLRILFPRPKVHGMDRRAAVRSTRLLAGAKDRRQTGLPGRVLPGSEDDPATVQVGAARSDVP